MAANQSRPNGFRRAITLVSITAIGTTLLAAAPLPRVEREGTGDRRAQLDTLEYAPFDFTKLESLTEWTTEAPMTAESTKGKVIAIIRWNAQDSAAIRFMPKVARAVRRFGEKNVTVLAVHGKDGWETAQDRHERGQVPADLALDTQHIFKNTFHADGSCDIYLIDRAGRLRYADLSPKSFERALSALVRETPEEAAKTARDEEPVANARPASRNKTDDSGDSAEDDLIEIEPELYKSAAWPAPNSDVRNAINVQDTQVSVAMGSEVMLTPELPLTRDKVTVVDFWATWCGPCHAIVPTLDRLQASLPQDLQIVGMGGQRDSEADIRQYLSANPSKFTQVFDPRQQLYRQVGVRAIPHVLVISTDGVVRWQGNPHNSGFVSAVTAIVEADPMIQARHEQRSDDE